MTWVIDAIRPLILSGWSEALPHVAIALGVLAVFDALCLYGGACAFKRSVG
jgi:ABC-2 type transport system permease protein